MSKKFDLNRRGIRRVIVFALIVLVVGALLRPKPPRPPTTITSVAELEAYLHALTAFGTPPGISLVVVKDGQVVYQRGFGLADGPRQLAATAETPYGWWSMTKLVTAAAILQLQEDGKLHIDDPVADYVPFFKVTYPSATSRPVTIRACTTGSAGHRAGAGAAPYPAPRRRAGLRERDAALPRRGARHGGDSQRHHLRPGCHPRSRRAVGLVTAGRRWATAIGREPTMGDTAPGCYPSPMPEEQM